MAFILEKIAWSTYAIVYPGSLQEPSTDLYFPLERKDMGYLITLSEAARRNLSWWVSNLATANGKPLKQNVPDVVIFSESSLGWGAFSYGVKTNDSWPLADH